MTHHVQVSFPVLSLNARLLSRALGRGTRLWGVLLALPLLAACHDVPAGFGSTPAAARANTDAVFGGFARRFTNVTRTPRYARARELIGRYALTPSSIYNDSTIWTVWSADGTRTLYGDASFANGRYLFQNVPTSEPLTTVADGRHIMRLKSLGNDEYSWFTGVDFAIGALTATDVNTTINRWLASAEGRSADAIRTDSRVAFPHTTAALGKLYSLDTLISVRDADGGNTVYAGIRFTPDGIRDALPDYAAYIDKYVKRARMRFRLTDRTGATWFDAAMKDGYLTLRTRSHNGHFSPFEGPARAIPDTLIVHLDMTVKISLFTVGVTNLTGEWVNVQSAHERGWAMRFTKEPDWQLPPTVGTLLRSPLRRPFEGEGTWFRLTVHDTPGAQTLLARRGGITVRESAVLRFLGKLGGAAMGDFVSKAEAQENQFNATVFNAMRDDFLSLL